MGKNSFLYKKKHFPPLSNPTRLMKVKEKIFPIIILLLSPLYGDFCRVIINELNLLSTEIYNQKSFIELKAINCQKLPNLSEYGIILVGTHKDKCRILLSADLSQNKFENEYFVIRGTEEIKTQSQIACALDPAKGIGAFFKAQEAKKNILSALILLKIENENWNQMRVIYRDRISKRPIYHQLGRDINEEIIEFIKKRAVDVILIAQNDGPTIPEEIIKMFQNNEKWGNMKIAKEKEDEFNIYQYSINRCPPEEPNAFLSETKFRTGIITPGAPNDCTGNFRPVCEMVAITTPIPEIEGGGEQGERNVLEAIEVAEEAQEAMDIEGFDLEREMENEEADFGKIIAMEERNHENDIRYENLKGQLDRIELLLTQNRPQG